MEKEFNILIVDDEKDFLETMGSFLKLKGYFVLTADDGHKAIDMIKQNKPDLVLLDVVMPEFDGVDTLKEIRKTAPDLDVIMITAHTSNERIKDAEEFGASAFFRKSSDFTHVAKMIENFLES